MRRRTDHYALARCAMLSPRLFFLFFFLSFLFSSPLGRGLFFIRWRACRRNASARASFSRDYLRRDRGQSDPPCAFCFIHLERCAVTGMSWVETVEGGGGNEGTEFTNCCSRCSEVGSSTVVHGHLFNRVKESFQLHGFQFEG